MYLTTTPVLVYSWQCEFLNSPFFIGSTHTGALGVKLFCPCHPTLTLIRYWRIISLVKNCWLSGNLSVLSRKRYNFSPRRLFISSVYVLNTNCFTKRLSGWFRVITYHRTPSQQGENAPSQQQVLWTKTNTLTSSQICWLQRTLEGGSRELTS